jgi:cytochrome b subunit of formate dehydrogenase
MAKERRGDGPGERRLRGLCNAGLGLVLGLALAVSGPAYAAAAAVGAALDNPGCLRCHGGQAHKVRVEAAEGSWRALRAVPPDKFAQGVHGKMPCVACHKAIADSPPDGRGHQGEPAQRSRSVGCAECHETLWDAARHDGTAATRPRLGEVVEKIGPYRKSFHARARKDTRDQVNATCDNCHDTHTFDIPPKGSLAHAQWRLDSAAALCGERCHGDEIDEYRMSVHGREAIDRRNPKSAVCADCHSAHGVRNTSGSPAKLAITARCGNCHQEPYRSYKATYHGQVNTLGYAYTAKCHDCHGGHGIREAQDPKSKVHAANRLKTCQSCHSGKKGLALATAGFATFEPHGRTDDFAHHPQMWLARKLMVGLLLVTFGFFWAHTALWLYREHAERQQGRLRAHVRAEAVTAAAPGGHVRRFSLGWRAAHLVFALGLMLLTLTGMPLFYPEAGWAVPVMAALGGPMSAGAIHRASAVVLSIVFFGHLAGMALEVWRRRCTFRWFGPDSLIPNLRDLRDIGAMFKWFVGRGPRPVFDRWTYWEKFDYWAPFWGIAVIGASGLMLWRPATTGACLPGWAFNVAAIFHGEEAFLAVVFLFTVHFFNNHFRPDKFPLETVMFTGSMSLERFRREHALHYQRLLASGELEKHLVQAPSAPMRLGSKMLGFGLLALGLLLLAGVAVGFFSGA